MSSFWDLYFAGTRQLMTGQDWVRLRSHVWPTHGHPGRVSHGPKRLGSRQSRTGQHGAPDPAFGNVPGPLPRYSDLPEPITDEEVQSLFGERIREVERITEAENTGIIAAYLREHGPTWLRDLDRLIADYLVGPDWAPPDEA
jgi:hypothetical protein